MNRLFRQKFGKLLNPRGSPPRGVLPQASSIVISLMAVFLVIGGLAHVFTALFNG
ncbi:MULTISPECIES: hypothetical protein [unclassified Rhizobium]|uniref:hypothetical protein n=1 Tax=unclassified Rhizobium TaxID=2613769 RepID=UPI000A3FAAD6|nr:MULTISPECIES: hypothetical protein [unclassified Rhizobium]